MVMLEALPMDKEFMVTMLGKNAIVIVKRS